MPSTSYLEVLKVLRLSPERRASMTSYSFDQRCRPRGDFRIPELVEFLELMVEAFRCRHLYDGRSKPLEIVEPNLRSLFEKTAARQNVGADEDFFTIPPRKRDNNTARIEIHTGTQLGKPFIDFYCVSMDKHIVPNLEYFEKSIEIFKPFEAFLSESKNERMLDAYNRQRSNPGFVKPATIRGFHYLNEDMANSIGGVDYCLKAPAWHVEEFCEGVLIWLVPALFDSENPEHLEAQEEVMAYFKMPYSRKRIP
jgi:hypothetical protein